MDDNNDGFIDVVTYGGQQYGDINQDGVVDAGETADPDLVSWMLPNISDGTVVTYDGKDYGDLNSDGTVDFNEPLN